MEKTLIMLKPNSFTQGIVGEVTHRIEQSKFKILAMKMFRFNRETAEKFYGEHKGKGFFEDLIGFMTSGPTVGMILESENAVVKMRKLVGATNPANADPGTIRYDYAPNGFHNVIHASDSPASVEREMKILFEEKEIVTW